ncbi:hypothetical protein CDL15_Pgr018230 [Punica granatum]|uniref:F-box domain-containing protein n=1 Tax=Punica granatum TaxID=22663 RepID=A0A218WHP4_PUNGR|nr:hypothetical protein CDL15_Pgr018230 [Punica granatum]
MEMALGSMGMMRLDLFDISGLPEGFRSTVIALISPRDACRVSAVSSVFKSAADSDSVWERFLPTDIDSVLSRASAAPYSQTLQLSPRKQLYLSLCHRPVLIDDGRWSFSLGRSSGKKCYMLSARELSIRVGRHPERATARAIQVLILCICMNRFPEVAELINVCWFEIWARFDVRILSLSTLYAAYLVFKFNPDSDGFENLPIEVGVHHVDGETIMNRTVYLDHDLELLQEGTDIYPKEREDGWLEIKLGEFPCNDGYDGEMRVNLMQVDYGCWKNANLLGSDPSSIESASLQLSGTLTSNHLVIIAIFGQNYYDPEDIPSGDEIIEETGARFGVGKETIMEANMSSYHSMIYPLNPILIPLKLEDCTESPGSFYCSFRSGYLQVGGLRHFLHLCSWYLTKQRSNNLKKKLLEQNGGFLLQQKLASFGSSKKARICTEEELERAAVNYSKSRFPGQGGYGTVYKGMLEDGTIVAAKKLKAIDRERIEQFVNDLIILSQINH